VTAGTRVCGLVHVSSPIDPHDASILLTIDRDGPVMRRVDVTGRPPRHSAGGGHDRERERGMMRRGGRGGRSGGRGGTHQKAGERVWWR
jgi:hypothetical protein